MNLWEQLNDFSDYNKRIPCILCGKDAEKTIVGEHWKCSVEGHIFNQDGSAIGVECYCDVCQPKRELEVVKNLKKKVGRSKKRK